MKLKWPANEASGEASLGIGKLSVDGKFLSRKHPARPDAALRNSITAMRQEIQHRRGSMNPKQTSRKDNNNNSPVVRQKRRLSRAARRRKTGRKRVPAP